MQTHVVVLKIHVRPFSPAKQVEICRSGKKEDQARPQRRRAMGMGAVAGVEGSCVNPDDCVQLTRDQTFLLGELCPQKLFGWRYLLSSTGPTVSIGASGEP